MYPIDLTTYFPELASISQDDLDSARAQLVQWLTPYFPDTDLTPGSVTGDRCISPVAASLAALNVALGRVMSDMIPENVAAGIQYNCDYIARFLQNYGVYDLATPLSSGTVRLVFDADLTSDLVLDQATMFQFGTEVYRVAGRTTITPSSSLSGTALRQITSASWAVDVRVTGTGVGSTEAGLTGSINTVIPSLISVVTATPLTTVSTPASLASLAKLTQRTALSTNTSPAGLESFVLERFSGGLSADVIVPSDPEFVACGGTVASNWKAPEAVLFARSTTEMTTYTQSFNLTWDVGASAYTGTVPFLYAPDKIESFTWTPDSSVDLTPYLTFTTAGPAGWVGESYAVSVALVPGPGGANTVIGSLDGEGNLVATFTVTYLCDPFPRQVDTVLGSREYRPVGLSILTKRPTTAWVYEMTVDYTRTPGTTMNLTQARAEIADYLNSAHYPENISESHIVDAMRWAGAAKVNNIYLAAVLSRTAADLGAVGPVDGENVALTHVYIDGSDRSFIDEAVAIDGFPYTIRSRRYRIDPSTIIFRENA